MRLALLLMVVAWCVSSPIAPAFARATVDATEEAVINAMIAARTMVGVNGNTIYAIPHDQVRDILRKFGRLLETAR